MGNVIGHNSKSENKMEDAPKSPNTNAIESNRPNSPGDLEPRSLMNAFNLAADISVAQEVAPSTPSNSSIEVNSSSQENENTVNLPSTVSTTSTENSSPMTPVAGSVHSRLPPEVYRKLVRPPHETNGSIIQRFPTRPFGRKQIDELNTFSNHMTSKFLMYKKTSGAMCTNSVVGTKRPPYSRNVTKKGFQQLKNSYSNVNMSPTKKYAIDDMLDIHSLWTIRNDHYSNQYCSLPALCYHSFVYDNPPLEEAALQKHLLKNHYGNKNKDNPHVPSIDQIGCIAIPIFYDQHWSCAFVFNFNEIITNTGVSNGTFPCILHYDSYRNESIHATKDVHLNIIKLLSGFIGTTLSKNVTTKTLPIYRAKSELRYRKFVFIIIILYSRILIL